MVSHPAGPSARAIRLRAVLIAALALVVVYFAPEPVPGVFRADFGASTAIAVVTLISSLFGLFGGKADEQLVRAFEGVRTGLADLGKRFVEYVAKAGSIFARIAGALRRFYSRFIAPLVSKIAAIVSRIKRILDQVLGPILRVVKKFRDVLMKIYDKVLRPIFDTIAAMRAVLQVLERLGVKAAGRLDDKLGEIEDSLRGPFLELLRRTNEVASWINRIVTLDGIFQRITLLDSMFAYRKDWISQFYRAQHRPLTPGEREDMLTTPDPPDPVVMATELRTYLRLRDGPLRARVDEMARSLEMRLGL